MKLEFEEKFELEFDELLSLEFDELLSLEFDELLSLEFDELLSLEFEELLSLELEELLSATRVRFSIEMVEFGLGATNCDCSGARAAWAAVFKARTDMAVMDTLYFTRALLKSLPVTGADESQRLHLNFIPELNELAFRGAF